MHSNEVLSLTRDKPQHVQMMGKLIGPTFGLVMAALIRQGKMSLERKATDAYLLRTFRGALIVENKANGHYVTVAEASTEGSASLDHCVDGLAEHGMEVTEAMVTAKQDGIAAVLRFRQYTAPRPFR